MLSRAQSLCHGTVRGLKTSYGSQDCLPVLVLSVPEHQAAFCALFPVTPSGSRLAAGTAAWPRAADCPCPAQEGSLVRRENSESVCPRWLSQALSKGLALVELHCCVSLVKLTMRTQVFHTLEVLSASSYGTVHG